VGGLLDIVASGGVIDYRHYIYAGSEPVAIISRKNNGTNTTYYLLSDQEGSIADITNSSGAVVVGESFTAYGSRRSPTTWSGAPSSSDLTTIAGITRHGYTFQDVLGTMGLNDMVGRVQDSITGRFLSADPTIPHPMDPQSYNPYSYTVNNPLTYTDPTGFADGDGTIKVLPYNGLWDADYDLGADGGLSGDMFSMFPNTNTYQVTQNTIYDPSTGITTIGWRVDTYNGSDQNTNTFLGSWDLVGNAWEWQSSGLNTSSPMSVGLSSYEGYDGNSGSNGGPAAGNGASSGSTVGASTATSATTTQQTKSWTTKAQCMASAPNPTSGNATLKLGAFGGLNFKVGGLDVDIDLDAWTLNIPAFGPNYVTQGASAGVTVFGHSFGIGGERSRSTGASSWDSWEPYGSSDPIQGSSGGLSVQLSAGALIGGELSLDHVETALVCSMPAAQ